MTNNYLEAMATAYDQAKEDAGIDDPANPYQEQLDNRREFVRQQVTDAFGTITDEDGADLFDGEVIDAILSAHDDWLALQNPTPAT